MGPRSRRGLRGLQPERREIVINAPLGPTAGLKVSASHQQRDGFLDNIYTHDTAYGRNELTTGNLQIDWNITPKLEANFGSPSPIRMARGHQSPWAMWRPLRCWARSESGGHSVQPVWVALYPWRHSPPRALAGRQRLPGPQPSDLPGLQHQSGLRLPIGEFTSITAFMKENDDASRTSTAAARTPVWAACRARFWPTR